ncbi:hypothetical protein SAMN04489710_11147 [Paracidovorax konjaci]|uniref:Uncharacterized protein n=1 Tax=Paracidovorax konjaci TaxID=32040 RepID=A0A1I1WY04_9BURK|nr:hypothetical protein SAMN04489710_11147 [Paracidovorax konjaci]
MSIAKPAAEIFYIVQKTLPTNEDASAAVGPSSNPSDSQT